MSVPVLPFTVSGVSTLNTHSVQQQSQSHLSRGNEHGQVAVVHTHYEHQQTSAYQLALGQQYGHSALTYAHLSNISHYSETSSAASEQLDAVKEVAPLQEGAKNILDFISQRIEREVAAGASDEAIDELLQQGLSGFEQGYGEALDILAGSGDLDGMVNDVVTTLYDQVVDGIEELRHIYLGEDTAGEPKGITDNNRQVVVEEVPPRQRFNDEQGQLLSTTFKHFSEQPTDTLANLLDSLDASSTRVNYTRQDLFSFELTTAEGDKVIIQAGSSSAFSGESDVVSSHRDQYAERNESGVKSSHFHFSVEGDIDEQESMAIEHLLDQVMSLSDEFYGGGIQSAYQVAMELGYDRNEITGYSLNLKQVETYQVAEVYQQLSPIADKPAPENLTIFERIGHYAQSVLATLNQPENYQHFNYLQLLEHIAEQVDAQVELDGKYGFYEAVSSITDSFA